MNLGAENHYTLHSLLALTLAVHLLLVGLVAAGYPYASLYADGRELSSEQSVMYFFYSLKRSQAYVFAYKSV
jgi:hypothetical protein